MTENELLLRLRHLKTDIQIPVPDAYLEGFHDAATEALALVERFLQAQRDQARQRGRVLAAGVSRLRLDEPGMGDPQ